MIKPALLAAIVGVSSISAIAATPVDDRQGAPLAADEAYILVDLGAKGALKQLVSSLNFSNYSAGIKLSIPKDNRLQLLKVKAGTYKPEAFVLASQKTKQLDIKRNTAGIKVSPGTVTYIGKWDIQYGQRVQWLSDSTLVESSGYNVKFNPDSVKKYTAENQWIKKYPLHISHMNGKQIANNWSFASGS